MDVPTPFPFESSRLAAAVVATLLLGAAVGPGVTMADEPPRIKAFVPEPTLAPGGTTGLTVQLVNDAPGADDRAETARNVEVTMHSGGTPIEIESDTRVIGAMEDGAVRDVPFRVTVPQDVEPGTYRLPIDLAYEFDDTSATTTVYATVRIEDRARFEVVSTETGVSVGETGAINVTLENAGTETASGATVALESKSGDVRFGGAASDTRYVGRWEPGQRKTVSYRITVDPDARTQRYALAARVSYETPVGESVVSPALSTGFIPLREQRFSVADVASTLEVGSEGVLRGTVVNRGPNAVRNAVVVFAPEDRNVNPIETEFPVGSLAPGERANFSFDVEISEAAGAGPRQFSVHVRYRDAADEIRRSNPLDLRAEVAPARDVFSVEPVDARVTAGGSATLTLRVTNAGGEEVSDISAKLFANDPLSTGDDEAFADSLAPGESTTITFGIAAAGSALEKSYPVSIDFQYDDADGDTLLSDTYLVPVGVEKPTGRDGPPIEVVGGVVVLLVVAIVIGVSLYRRRGQ